MEKEEEEEEEEEEKGLFTDLLHMVNWIMILENVNWRYVAHLRIETFLNVLKTNRSRKKKFITITIKVSIDNIYYTFQLNRNDKKYGNQMIYKPETKRLPSVCPVSKVSLNIPVSVLTKLSSLGTLTVLKRLHIIIYDFSNMLQFSSLMPSINVVNIDIRIPTLYKHSCLQRITWDDFWRTSMEGHYDNLTELVALWVVYVYNI